PPGGGLVWKIFVLEFDLCFVKTSLRIGKQSKKQCCEGKSKRQSANPPENSSAKLCVSCVRVVCKQTQRKINLQQ
uniref:Uncharacterized protein n=1 Tax=Anopheles dirus TaxID=7168 RepID=A0A182NYE5_9DIPT